MKGVKVSTAPRGERTCETCVSEKRARNPYKNVENVKFYQPSEEMI